MGFYDIKETGSLPWFVVYYGDELVGRRSSCVVIEAEEDGKVRN